MSDVPHNEPELRPEESYEPDHPAAGLLFVQVTALTIVTIGLMLIGWRVWVWGTQYMLHEQQGLPIDARLVQTQQRDQALLKDYAAAEKGRYRIPIDQAMVMLAADSKLLAPEAAPPPLAPAVPATPAPESAVPAPALAATPTDSAAPAPAATATPQAPAPPTK